MHANAKIPDNVKENRMKILSARKPKSVEAIIFPMEVNNDEKDINVVLV